MTKLPFRKSGKVGPWKFTVIYLGSCFPEDRKFLPTVKNRICCAKSVVKRLIDRVLCQHKAERTFPWYSCIFCIAPIWSFKVSIYRNLVPRASCLFAFFILRGCIYTAMRLSSLYTVQRIKWREIRHWATTTLFGYRTSTMNWSVLAKICEKWCTFL